MSFEENVKSWVNIDNIIKKKNEEIKALRETRGELNNKLVKYASENNLSHRVIEINDGLLKFQNRKETAPLTLKYIKNCLTECISEEEQVNVLMQYIKEKREYKFVGELKRNYK